MCSRRNAERICCILPHADLPLPLLALLGLPFLLLALSGLALGVPLGLAPVLPLSGDHFHFHLKCLLHSILPN